VATTLDLSMEVDPLKVGYVLGYAYDKSVDYSDRDSDADPYVTKAWPQAPVLNFVDPTLADVTATLHPGGPDLDIANARATFHMSVEQVAALHAVSKKTVHFLLNGEPLYIGLAVRRG
jgi:hypothetical protein